MKVYNAQRELLKLSEISLTKIRLLFVYFTEYEILREK